MSVVPFSPRFTLNTTKSITASRSTVWPVVKAMDEWSSFQDIFKVDLVNQDAAVEVGQQILITSKFPRSSPVTLEEYDEIIEEERICWTVRGFVVGPVTLQTRPWLFRTARCIELFDDDDGGTILHNWISYAGALRGVVTVSSGKTTQNLFDEFNTELANKFQTD